jgi:protein-S-isoprenylcysteine O-methyltransferase Ste14
MSFMAATAGLVAFTALDVFRLHLLGRPLFAASLGGMLLFIGGNWIITSVLRTNAFAWIVVRHQAERGHTVVNTGVYRVVRHPMYAGLIPTQVGMCLWLQSYAAALLAVVPIGILVARIVLEERLLGGELEGYDAYMAKVRYRLIPGVW